MTLPAANFHCYGFGNGDTLARSEVLAIFVLGELTIHDLTKRHNMHRNYVAPEQLERFDSSLAGDKRIVGRQHDGLQKPVSDNAIGQDCIWRGLCRDQSRNRTRMRALFWYSEVQSLQNES